MGFTSTDKSIFSPDMPQTPENVAKVLDVAGWTVAEAAAELNMPHGSLLGVVNGNLALTGEGWLILLDKAGRRAFDRDEDSK